MIIEKNEARQKLAKIQQGHRLEFSLSPHGFLLIKQGNVLDCGNYLLYCNGAWYRREGFMFESSTTIPDAGLFLGAHNYSKFLAPRENDKCEFSSHKKPLSADFSFVLFFRATNRLALLVADGAFAPEAFIITLADKPENERFCFAMIQNVLKSRDPEASRKLTEEKEADEDEQEEA